MNSKSAYNTCGSTSKSQALTAPSWKTFSAKTAIAEMKHAERLAERLDYLNGVPTTKPDPIFVGGSLIEMLKQDEQDEEEAIELYKEAIQVAAEEGDYTTRRMLEEILAEEENHINTFGKLLVGMTEPFTQPGISQVG